MNKPAQTGNQATIGGGNMTTFPSRMRGVSVAGWMVIIVLTVVLGTAALRVIPVYLEYSTIKTAINGLLADSKVGLQSENEIRATLEKRFNVNNVNAISARELMISKDSGLLYIGFDYEVREPLFGNVDLILSFKQDFEKYIR